MVNRDKNPVTAGSMPNNDSRTHRPKKNQNKKRGGGLKQRGEFYGKAPRMEKATRHPQPNPGK